MNNDALKMDLNVYKPVGDWMCGQYSSSKNNRINVFTVALRAERKSFSGDTEK